ncbi:MAG: helix-turn-helix domain-containing protein [Fibrella sp.]|nr:helix-turn-helix domain-containing protein [Armatimonadota bacterium]
MTELQRTRVMRMAARLLRNEGRRLDGDTSEYSSSEDFHQLANMMEAVATEIESETTLTVQDAAAYLHLHEETILRAVRSKRLPAMRTSAGKGGRVRVRRADLDRVFSGEGN